MKTQEGEQNSGASSYNSLGMRPLKNFNAFICQTFGDLHAFRSLTN